MQINQVWSLFLFLQISVNSHSHGSERTSHKTRIISRNASTWIVYIFCLSYSFFISIDSIEYFTFLYFKHAQNLTMFKISALVVCNIFRDLFLPKGIHIVLETLITRLALRRRQMDLQMLDWLRLLLP